MGRQITWNRNKETRVGAQQLYIYTLYIQQADVFLANKDIINLEGGAQESSDWSAPEPGSWTRGLGFSNVRINTVMNTQYQGKKLSSS